MERYKQEHTLLLKGEKTVKNRGSASNEHKYQYLQSRKACLESLVSVTGVEAHFFIESPLDCKIDNNNTPAHNLRKKLAPQCPILNHKTFQMHSRFYLMSAFASMRQVQPTTNTNEICCYNQKTISCTKL